MTRYVYRDGRMVQKVRMNLLPDPDRFPSPRVSRFEAMESPVTGEIITSWRERERDMNAADAYDPRDLAGDHVQSKGRVAQARELIDGAGNGHETGNIWGKWDNATVGGGTPEEPA